MRHFDLTDRKRIEDELGRAKAAAEAANVAKSQFLASMSHELQTPMNAILGMMALALAEQLPAIVRDYLQTAKESADLLLGLLNEILDFCRIESGRFRLEHTPFSPRDVVEQVLKTLAVRAHEKGLELVAEFQEQLPAQVGDPLRLRQASGFTSASLSSRLWLKLGMETPGRFSRKNNEGQIFCRGKPCSTRDYRGSRRRAQYANWADKFGDGNGR